MKTLFFLLAATCFAQFSPLVSVATTAVSASTIAPTSPIVTVSGTATITTITPPPGCTTTGAGCSVTLIATGAWQMNATVVPFTAVASTVYTLKYVGGLWYGGPTGGGSSSQTDRQTFNLCGGGTGGAAPVLGWQISNESCFAQAVTGANSLAYHLGIVVLSVNDWAVVTKKRPPLTWSAAARHG